MAWFTWVLGRTTDQKMTCLDELMPWRYAASACPSSDNLGHRKP
ncbi:MAG: hypothetical protein AAFR47_15035 [Pseudomonadota bacterium]